MKNTNRLLTLMFCIMIVIIITIGGLFIKVNQLEHLVRPGLDSLLEGLEIGTKAPAFSLLNTNEELLSLNDFHGQNVLLFFSSTSCPYCTEVYPHVITLNKKNNELIILMISHGTESENKDLAKQLEFNFPILHLEEKVAQDYKVPGTPFFYIIDEEGTIINSGTANTLIQLEKIVSIDTGRQ